MSQQQRTLKLTVLAQHWGGIVPRLLCKDSPRPCRREDCRYHLWPEISTTERSQPGRPSSKRITRDELHTRPSCAIDVAEDVDEQHPDGARSLGEVANILGVSRVAVVLIEARATAKLAQIEQLRTEYESETGVSPRRRY